MPASTRAGGGGLLLLGAAVGRRELGQLYLRVGVRATSRARRGRHSPGCGCSGGSSGTSGQRCTHGRAGQVDAVGTQVIEDRRAADGQLAELGLGKFDDPGVVARPGMDRIRQPVDLGPPAVVRVIDAGRANDEQVDI